MLTMGIHCKLPLNCIRPTIYYINLRNCNFDMSNKNTFAYRDTLTNTVVVLLCLKGVTEYNYTHECDGRQHSKIFRLSSVKCTRFIHVMGVLVQSVHYSTLSCHKRCSNTARRHTTTIVLSCNYSFQK